jgi:hypothetical protein
MDIKVKPDGSTVVTCGTDSVTINPPASPPATPASGGSGGSGAIPYPNTTAAIRSLQHLGSLDDILGGQTPLPRAGDSGIQRSLVLHVTDAVDISAVKDALRNAGHGDLEIEIVPAPQDG